MTSTRVHEHSASPRKGEWFDSAVDTRFSERSDGALPTPGLAEICRIAFGDRTAARMVVHPDDPPAVRWMAAVALGGRGRYGAAYALLERIVRSPSAPDAIRAHAAITRASHLRQLGGHRWARRWDGLGLSFSSTALAGSARLGPAQPGSGPPGTAWPGRSPGTTPLAQGDPDRMGFDAAAARVDALLGLAADALGLAELDLASRLLTDVERCAYEHPSWRPRVRLRWIRAELALALDDPGQAQEHAERALEASRDAGAVRHEVKSELVLLVARSCPGEPAAQLSDELEALSERASAARLDSLEWPMRLLLTRTFRPAHPVRSTRHATRYHELLTGIGRATDPFGRMMLARSPWVLVDHGP